MILPMVKYLEGFGVQFHYDTKVTNIAFDCAGSKKQATRIDILHDGQESSIDLTENDLVFITNGGCVPRRVQARNQGGRRLGPVAQDRRAGPELRPPRQVLL